MSRPAAPGRGGNTGSRAEATMRPTAALVTGGARRIGRAIVEGLAADGVAVAIHCHRSVDDAQRLAGSIVERGGRAVVVTGDFGRPAQAEAAFAAAEAAIGPITLLVNNASIFEDDAAAALDVARMQNHLAVNLTAPCLLASAVARRLPDDATGLIVNIVDQRVLKPTPQFFSYSLSKAGLWWATRTMAQAFAPRLRVVALAPGPTLKSARQDEAAFSRQSSAVPLGQGPALADIARTIRWIRDTPSVTGQIIALDGGQHLAWQTPDVVGVGE